MYVYLYLNIIDMTKDIIYRPRLYHSRSHYFVTEHWSVFCDFMEMWIFIYFRQNILNTKCKLGLAVPPISTIKSNLSHTLCPILNFHKRPATMHSLWRWRMQCLPKRCTTSSYDYINVLFTNRICFTFRIE